MATAIAAGGLYAWRSPSSHPLLALAVLFAILYSAWVVLSATLVAFDPIGDRLLAPLVVPLVWVASAVARSPRRADLISPVVVGVAGLFFLKTLRELNQLLT